MSAEPVAEPVVLEDGLAYPLASAMLACLCSELATTPGGEACECSLIPGATVAMDWCGCGGSGCGMAWVRVDSVFPSDSFPNPASAPRNCEGPFAVRLHVGVFRCLPVMDASGNPPSAAAQTEATRIALGDMAGALRAIRCCLPARRLVLGQWVSVSAGDCGGGFWPVTVQVV